MPPFGLWPYYIRPFWTNYERNKNKCGPVEKTFAHQKAFPALEEGLRDLFLFQMISSSSLEGKGFRALQGLS
jgi:hypothetical protein